MVVREHRPQFAVPVWQQPEPGDPAPLLAQAAALLVQAKARSFAFSLNQWGDLELLEAVVTADDQAQIRAMAPVYLAAQLEAAGLIPAVEVLSGLAITGGLKAQLGPAADKIASFWQLRKERFSEDERRSMFGQLFG